MMEINNMIYWAFILCMPFSIYWWCTKGWDNSISFSLVMGFMSIYILYDHKYEKLKEDKNGK